MRQFFAIFLLISFSVQLRGYHIYFHYQQRNLRKSAKIAIRQRIKDDNAEEFVFSLADGHEMPTWENDHEFSFRGEMYDVIDKRIENGKMYIRCVSDKKETALVDNYRKMTKDDFAGSSKKRTSLIVKLISTFYTQISIADKNLSLLQDRIKWFTLTPSLLFNKREVITPPPQFV
ncbi:MAG: hypothetical protein ABIP79_14615 [Chitinophagaceae bacterium]